jgi:hypothetical protein
MMKQKLDFMHKGHIDIPVYKTNESKLMIHYLCMHTLTLQDMKQATSVVSNITWGQELFRLVCYVEKSHGHDQLHLYVFISFINSA